MIDSDSLSLEVESWFASLSSATRFGQFFSAGLIGLISDNLVLVLLVELTTLSPTIAKVGSWECAVIVIFLVNDQWTFSDHRTDGWAEFARRFLTSNLIRFGGLCVTLAVLYVLHTWFEVWYVLANILGIGIGFVLNYLFESTITWRVHRN